MFHKKERSFITALDEYNQIFVEVYQQMSEKLSSIRDFVSIITNTMVLLNNQTQLHGYQKKEMVLDLAAKLIEDMNVSEEEKTVLRHYVFSTLGNTVDLFIATAKGYLMLKKAKENMDKKCIGGKCFSKKMTTVKRDMVVESVIAPIDISQLTNDIYEQLKKIVQNKTINSSNIIQIATVAMQLIQQYMNIPGAQKKQIVMDVVSRLINEIQMNESDRDILRSIVSMTLDKTIDLVIGIANGDIDILKIIDDGIVFCKKTCCSK